MEKIVIRPSSIVSSLYCPHSWYSQYVLGERSIQNVRAMFGTAIHKGIEHLWSKNLLEQKKLRVSDLDEYITVAFEEFVKTLESAKRDGYIIEYSDWREDSIHLAAMNLISEGVRVYIETLYPYLDMPIAVEKKLSKPIVNHPYVKAVEGTIDFLGKDFIGDVKTSKRKINPESYSIQLSTYKMLAEYSGYKVNKIDIFGVVLTKTPYAEKVELQPNVNKSEYLIDILLKKLTAVHEGEDHNVIFPINPTSYLCDVRFCSQYNSCIGGGLNVGN